MKIEYKGKTKTEAEEGDLIKFHDKVIGLVVDRGDWKYEYCKGDLAVVLLKDSDEDDFMQLAESYQIYFEDGDYKIIGNMENAKLILGGEKENGSQ